SCCSRVSAASAQRLTRPGGLSNAPSLRRGTKSARLRDMRLEFSDDAIADLHACADLIAVDSPMAADRFMRTVHRTIGKLLEFPGMGRARHYRNPGLAGLRSVGVTGF